MTRILQVTRNLPREDLTYEPFLDNDGQGLPSYGTPVSFEANVLEYSPSFEGAQFVTDRGGSKHRLAITLWIVGDAANVPQEEDRINRPSLEQTFIATEVNVVQGLWYTTAEADHYEIRCREA
jgi:hypothetical protein